MIHELDEEMMNLMQEVDLHRITQNESASFALAMAAYQQAQVKSSTVRRMFFGRLFVALLTSICVIGVILGASAEAALVVLSISLTISAIWRALVWWAEVRLEIACRENVLIELHDLQRRHPDNDREIVNRLTAAAEDAAEDDEGDT